MAEGNGSHKTGELEPLPAPATGWLRVIEKMIDKGVGADILTKVFELQQKAEAEQARRAFVVAFADFKAEAPAAIERTGVVNYPSKQGGQVDYSHVELDHACKELTPILSKHGLAHSWEVSPADDAGWLTVSCRLEHVAGHSRSVTLRAQADMSGSKNAIQGAGSTIYYLERYTFLAVLGIAQSYGDNDGNNGNGGTLSAEQIGRINDLLGQCESVGYKPKFADFCAWAGGEGCDTLEKVSAKRFENIVEWLRHKLKARPK